MWCPKTDQRAVIGKGSAVRQGYMRSTAWGVQTLIKEL